MEVSFMYQKERREFGRSVNRFSITEPVPSGSFKSDATERKPQTRAVLVYRT